MATAKKPAAKKKTAAKKKAPAKPLTCEGAGDYLTAAERARAEAAQK